MVWPRADLRSAGPPTSKMYLGAEYRSTCYERFQRHRAPFSPFLSPRLSLLFSFATVGREKFRCRTNIVLVRATSRMIRREPTGNNNSRVLPSEHFHLRPINYEYRPKDCSLSGAYPSVWRTWEGIRFQRRLSSTRRGDPFSR